MAAVARGNETDLYVAPCTNLVDKGKKEARRTIYKVTVKKTGIDKYELGKRTETLCIAKKNKLKNGKTFKAKEIQKINSISAWKYKKTQYLIINCRVEDEDNANYVFNVMGNTLFCKYVFKTDSQYKKDRNVMSQQGATFMGNNNKYYLVASHAYNRGGLSISQFESVWSNAYVFRFSLKVNGKNIKATRIKSKKFVASKRKVKWKNGRFKKYKRRLEMQDLFIYKGRAFFNSEGGGKCLDLIGSFEEK